MTPIPPPCLRTPRKSTASRGLCLALLVASLLLGGCGYKGELVQADPAAQGAEAQTGDEDADAKPSAQED